MYQHVARSLVAASAAALLAARASSRRPVTLEQALEFVGSLPMSNGEYHGNRKAFKRGQRSERAHSRKLQNRRLHPRAGR